MKSGVLIFGLCVSFFGANAGRDVIRGWEIVNLVRLLEICAPQGRAQLQQLFQQATQEFFEIDAQRLAVCNAKAENQIIEGPDKTALWTALVKRDFYAKKLKNFENPAQ